MHALTCIPMSASACKLYACTNIQITDVELYVCIGAKCIHAVYKHNVVKSLHIAHVRMRANFYKGCYSQTINCVLVSTVNVLNVLLA